MDRDIDCCSCRNPHEWSGAPCVRATFKWRCVGANWHNGAAFFVCVAFKLHFIYYNGVILLQCESSSFISSKE